MSQRSCGRCYSIKVKCQPGRGHGTCRRCERLGHHCQTARKLRPLGRKPKPRSPPTYASSIEEPNTDSNTTIPLPPAPATLPYPASDALTLTAHPAETTILRYLLDTTSFIPHFIIGPTFAPSMQQSLQTRLSISPQLLREGFLACAGELALQSHHLALPTTLNLTRCATAICKLRALQPRHLSEVKTMLALGTAILTYDQLAEMEGKRGGGASMVCRYMLSQCEPWYARFLSKMPEMDFEMNCLIYLETVECIMHRRVPVLRLAVREQGVVDRYVGVCYTLLPLLYNVCVVGNQIKEEGGWMLADGRRGKWEAVRQAISDWRPTPPSTFMLKYTATEVVCMLTQASVYRQLGLLVLHRLRYPFGVEDVAAGVYAEAIFAECASCFNVAGQYPFKIGFAIFVAGIEVLDAGKREGLIATHFGAAAGLYARSHARVRDVWRRVWKERDVRGAVSWFDIVSTVPEFRYIP
ncbi:hypothetical protein BJY04DRAFT_227546 [Aspergillus karnatakaensis]|uniref:uncharacterized protein n=1 Tax=Aspergillus karnatakaensis TaxID=1810916 RepID=UPI003CCD1298